MAKLDDHRQEVLTHLKYIKERVDINSEKLDKVNGRVRAAENKISFLQGFGSLVTFILLTFSSVLAYFINE